MADNGDGEAVPVASLHLDCSDLRAQVEDQLLDDTGVDMDTLGVHIDAWNDGGRACLGVHFEPHTIAQPLAERVTVDAATLRDPVTGARWMHSGGRLCAADHSRPAITAWAAAVAPGLASVLGLDRTDGGE